MTDPTPYFFGIKVSTLIASSVMGVIAVLLDIRRHSVLTALLAVTAGIAVAAMFTDPIIAGMRWPDDWNHAVAGVLGISGRNVIVWISIVSKDPMDFWDRVRGKTPPKK